MVAIGVGVGAFGLPMVSEADYQSFCLMQQILSPIHVFGRTIKLRKLFKYAWRGKWLYFTSLLCLFIAVVSDSIRPMVTSRIIDEVLVGRDSSHFVLYLVFLALISAVMAVGYYYQEFLSDRISALSHKGIRRDLFRHIQTLDQSFFQKNNPAELMSRTKQDVENVGFCFGFICVFLVEMFVHVTLFSVMLARISVYGLIVPLTMMPFIFLIAFFAERKGDRFYDQISDETATMNDKAGEALSGIRTVKAFGRERYERHKFRVHNRKYRDLNIGVDYLWANTMTPMSMLARVMEVLSILSAGILVILDKVTLGEAAAIAVYSGQLAWPMMELGWVFQAICTAIASARKLNDIFATKTRIESGSVPAPDSSVLEFDDVTLELDGKKILDDVSFTLPEGRTLGIMGATGSGKSTICNLAVRFLDPTSGSVKLGGEDISKMDLKSLREKFGIVTQEVFLFSDRIDENIRIGKKHLRDTDSARIHDVLEKADASEFVMKLDEKEETIIGEKGVGLSGGQKQRLSIARAFYRSAPILILDDATSALDMETEKDIQRVLERNRDMSRIIIAHRISAVRNADEIIYLDKGRIVERGTHDELIALNGMYYDTYVAQYGKEEF